MKNQNHNVPAFFSKCQCQTQDCPNRILWINKETLDNWNQRREEEDFRVEDEIGGCIPVADLTPNEFNFLKETYFDWD